MSRLFQTTTTVGDLVERGRDLVEDLLPQVDIDGAVETVKAEPLLLAILIGVGVLAVGVFFWGIVKQLFKAAFIAGVLGAAAWIWYFNIR